MIQVYNASTKPQYVPGIAVCASGARVQGYVPQSVFDEVFEKLLRDAPLTGLAVMDPGNQFTIPVTQGFFAANQARATGAGNIAATTRMQVGVTTTVGYTLTLPAASAVTHGLPIYIFNDATVGGYSLSIARAGADTIDGGAGPYVLTAAANTRRFVSNGVNGWTTS